uniref:Heat shock protein 70 n=1 Tax=Acrobeloides nanus TaxID=290746 RepID=A0A914C2Y3_9BILA
MSNGPAIGIDLGTTYSVAAIYRNGRVEIIPNEESNAKNLTPSTVSYGEKELLIGDPAKKKLVSNHSNVVYDMKRLIGKQLNDEKIDRSKHFWNFKIEPDGSGKPVVKVKYLGNPLDVRPEEVSAKVLEKLVEATEKKAYGKPKEAVITVPAYFNQGQKQGTIDAAEKAGLKVIELLTEPAAAAYGYLFKENRLNDKCDFLVFDFGGGTFDVAVVSVDKGNVKVQSVGGDSHLGGRDLDNKLAKHISEEIFYHHEVDVEGNRKYRSKLYKMIEDIKIELSTSLETSIYLGELHDDLDENLTVTRDRFEELCQEIFERTIRKTKATLKDAEEQCNIKQSDIKEILLVGGSTRIPKIRQLLNKEFPSLKLNFAIDADEAVAYGAAIRAAQASGALKAEISLTQATPLSIVPFSITRTRFTANNNQTAILFKIVESVRPLVDDSNEIGRLDLEGIKPNEAGQEKVKLTMSLDKNGILTVFAQYDGRTETMKINYSDQRSKASRNVDELLDEAERFRESDRVEKNRRVKQNELHNILQKVDFRLDKSASNRNKYTDAQNWYDNNPKAPENEIEKQIEALQEQFKSIL